MTEVIYYSDSISKVVTVFVIECAIVFGFIIFLMFCCACKIFTSKDVSVKDVFTFKKYSSKNKISDIQIETLYEPNTTETNDKSKNKSKSMGTKLYEYIFGNSIDKEKKPPKESIGIKEKIEPKNNSGSLPPLCSITDIECGAQQETNKIEENKTIDDVKKCVVLSDKVNKESVVELDLSAKKIYLVYEFNNLDKMKKSTSYMESDSTDVFDELEEFINTVIKSFTPFEI